MSAHLSTSEVTEELSLHELTPEQIATLLDQAQEHGQVMFTSPSTLEPVTLMADDDEQSWHLLDSAREV